MPPDHSADDEPLPFHCPTCGILLHVHTVRQARDPQPGAVVRVGPRHWQISVPALYGVLARVVIELERDLRRPKPHDQVAMFDRMFMRYGRILVHVRNAGSSSHGVREVIGFHETSLDIGGPPNGRKVRRGRNRYWRACVPKALQGG